VPAIDDLLKLPPYRSAPAAHDDLFRAAMGEAIQHHYANCPPFARWYRKQGADPEAAVEDLALLPFLPVTAFKRMNLQSVGGEAVVRLLKSSATSSQTPSSVALDATTRNRQMRTLGVLMSDMLGAKRRPFLVLDAAPGTGSDVELSARVAGMRGYLMMASETHYVMEAGPHGLALDTGKLRTLLDDYAARQTPVCLIGYTYMLYQQAVRPLVRGGLEFALPRGSHVLHFGGWKRLERQAVGREELNRGVRRVFGVEDRNIKDVYGFTEQLGIIYPDDGQGVRRAPVYSEVLVRDPFTLRLQPDGVPGMLQFLTPLPHSYPGISVLLDDMGRIVSRNGGTHFEVLGRAKGSEIRGCGDTLPERVYEVRS
jgi:hypothetical protein